MLENVCRIASDFRTLGRYGVQFCSLANKFVDSTINVGGCTGLNRGGWRVDMRSV